MANLRKLQALVPAVHAEFFERSRAAEDAREREHRAATAIQKHARGFLTRRRIERLRERVITIQRVWRGYLGRQRALLAREARDRRLREAYFAAMATTIQRHWRGFWSRKYVFDFHARKLYLARVAQLNANMRAVLAEEGERAAYTQKALAQEAARAAFDEKISRLHHLLSTSSQPGIFASPYALAAGTVPVIAGAPVEEHLKAAFRKTGGAPARQQQGNQTSPARLGAFLPPIVKSNASSPTATRGPGQLQPQQQSPLQQASVQERQSGVVSSTGRQGAGVYPTEVLMTGLERVVPRNLTLRQTVPYDVVHQAQVLEAKVVKAEMMMRHPVPFASSLRKPEQPALAVQTNQNLEGYHDPYDPTIGARTETFTPRQASMSPTRFAKYNAKQPYFDAELLPPADVLPPKTFRPAPAPAHAAGLSSAEVRRRATKPAR